jgi:hypothetical protein
MAIVQRRASQLQKDPPKNLQNKSNGTVTNISNHRLANSVAWLEINV